MLKNFWFPLETRKDKNQIDLRAIRKGRRAPRRFAPNAARRTS
uniref:Uncharacterized protein n=1 Tax=Sinorhizobium fredii (strain HH103) TaxID=1117943 RepID=A0A0A8WHA1_SINF1|nr:hypothetical protein [Sinorhizobium fredii HH103]